MEIGNTQIPRPETRRKSLVFYVDPAENRSREHSHGDSMKIREQTIQGKRVGALYQNGNQFLL